MSRKQKHPFLAENKQATTHTTQEDTSLVALSKKRIGQHNKENSHPNPTTHTNTQEVTLVTIAIIVLIKIITAKYTKQF